ncbi:STAS-like domain-containing protein [Conexibacter stalactiti]|uniref:STAS-like domain-containing protein n=1 Tax=Conexibacter stalactiti TaxID=1940611 RepID=A0ABU4HV30_9ACTN|nr:STAS-like domain-containing protein [Conexibacter stalactiti]MDW5597166.1 STAS-like domain-containing protein [Conexibacter stalactiti]MEC5037808.1 STAS-like domain-containing protein [Conexibacter stalactiti]
MSTTLRPAEIFGPGLVGRSVATPLREDVERRLAAGESVVLDFTGVMGISPSFADELLAKLPVDAWDEGRVQMIHLPRVQADFARMLITSRRMQRPEATARTSLG